MTWTAWTGNLRFRMFKKNDPSAVFDLAFLTPPHYKSRPEVLWQTSGQRYWLLKLMISNCTLVGN